MSPEYPEYTPKTDEEDGVSISEYLVILLDEWPVALVPLLLVLVVAVGYLLTAVPSYRASGVIQVSTSDSSGASALLELADVGQPSPVETEVEILRSRRIVGKALEALSLNIVQKVPPRPI